MTMEIRVICQTKTPQKIVFWEQSQQPTTVEADAETTEQPGGEHCL